MVGWWSFVAGFRVLVVDWLLLLVWATCSYLGLLGGRRSHVWCSTFDLWCRDQDSYLLRRWCSRRVFGIFDIDSSSRWSDSYLIASCDFGGLVVLILLLFRSFPMLFRLSCMPAEISIRIWCRERGCSSPLRFPRLEVRRSSSRLQLVDWTCSLLIPSLLLIWCNNSIPSLAVW